MTFFTGLLRHCTPCKMCGAASVHRLASQGRLELQPEASVVARVDFNVRGRRVADIVAMPMHYFVGGRSLFLCARLDVCTPMCWCACATCGAAGACRASRRSGFRGGARTNQPFFWPMYRAHGETTFRAVAEGFVFALPTSESVRGCVCSCMGITVLCVRWTGSIAVVHMPSIVRRTGARLRRSRCVAGPSRHPGPPPLSHESSSSSSSSSQEHPFLERC